MENKNKTENISGTLLWGAGGPRIAIYTLTRDRLEYTKHCFKSLLKNAGMPYDHYILDNGSIDGSAEWLRANEHYFKKVIYMPENVGISAGSNLLLDEIAGGGYDIIIKMDNDCEIVTANLLTQVTEVFEGLKKTGTNMVLSPRVNGINKQPHRARYADVDGFPIGITGIVGGLFHMVPSAIYANYRYPAELPKAWGQDDHFCEWLRLQDIPKGYIENIVVNHYETTEGQAVRFPEYFVRKWNEEKQ